MVDGVQLGSEDVKMKSESVSKGIGACDLLLIAFIVLKLLKIITWSWWWVFAPFWIPLALVLIIEMAFFFVMKIIDTRGRKRKKKQAKT